MLYAGPVKKKVLIPESCTKYRSEAQKALCLKRNWSDFDPQAYDLYDEDQNHETSFKDKALQAVVDIWCKIQVKRAQKPSLHTGHSIHSIFYQCQHFYLNFVKKNIFCRTPMTAL